MKPYLFLSIMSLAFSVTGCRRDHSLDIKSLNSTWKVVSYQNLISHSVTTKASLESGMSGHDLKDKDIIVSLKIQDDILQLQGHTVYNTVSGKFQLGKDESLHCLSFGGTKIAEPNWESWFWDAMNSADAFQLKGDTLTIDYHFQDNQDGKWGVALKRE